MKKKAKPPTTLSPRLFAVLVAIGLVSFLSPGSAQDATPPDRNAVNTATHAGDMMLDSPATFAKKGDRFYRDVVHANEYGEQILARILMAFWVPETKPKKS